MVVIGGSRKAAPAEAPAASRGSRYRREEPEAEAPSRGRARRDTRGNGSTGEDNPTKGRARGRAPAEEEKAPARAPQRGWAGSKKVREETFNNIRFTLPDDDPVLIYFMQDEPFDSAAAHFLRDLRDGQKLFICPGKKPSAGYPDGCPLCRVGDQPSARSYFNIVQFDNDGEGELRVWEAGPGYSGEIQKKQDSRIVGGKLSSVYFEVVGVKAASGRGATKLQIDPVQERDLPELFDMDPLTDAEYDVFAKDLQAEGYVKYPPLSALQAAADKLDALGD